MLGATGHPSEGTFLASTALSIPRVIYFSHWTMQPLYGDMTLCHIFPWGLGQRGEPYLPEEALV
jgi:hypothetical protein